MGLIKARVFQPKQCHNLNSNFIYFLKPQSWLVRFSICEVNAKLVSALTSWKSQTNTAIYKLEKNVYNVLNAEILGIGENVM